MSFFKNVVEYLIMTIELILYYILIFVAGAVFGSFFNVVADRTVSGESILFGRSKCDHCKKPLKAKNLFPIFSFLFQKGKCSECGQKLSWYYPFSEIVSGLIFVGVAHYTQVFQNFGWVYLLAFFYLVSVFSVYLIIFLTDVKYRIIPDKVVYAGIWFVLLFFISYTVINIYLTYKAMAADDFGKYLIASGFFTQQVIAVLKSFGIMLLSSLGIALFFLLLIFITRGRGMGGGDVKLGFLIGLVNAFPTNVLGIFLGFFLGALFSLVLILFKRKTIKDTIAFGPFLILGSVVAFFFGDVILNWYGGLF